MIVDWIIDRAKGRAPDSQIGGAEHPYRNRWWLIPRNRWFNIYLHQFVRDDDDRALHDHPWLNCSIILRGAYTEIVFVKPPLRPRDGADGLTPSTVEVARRLLRPVFRRPATAHRVTLPRDANNQPIPCWSLFLTGPTIRQWGFWCPRGRWVHWRDFTAGDRGEIVGRGCE